MTWSPTEIAKIVRYYTGVVFAMLILMAGVIATSLIGFWRTAPCYSDIKPRVVGLAILGTISSLAAVVNLFRLRHKLDFVDDTQMRDSKGTKPSR